MGPVLVFGHRNPDNDSVCSAVAYAHLKNVTDSESVYVAARLGPATPETRWVFERFCVELPAEIAHVRTRVRDAMTAEPLAVPPDATLLEAGRLMRTHGIRALPVVADGVVRGLVSDTMLAERHVEGTTMRGFAGRPVRVEQIVRVLEGELLAGDAGAQLAGDVLIGAMEPDTMVEHIRPGDVLIVGDRKRTQPMALSAGVSCLIVTGGARPDEGVLDDAARRDVTVILTEHDTFGTARLVELSHTVESVMDTGVLLVSPDDLLSEVAEDLIASPHREAIAVDADGRLLGVLTRSNVVRGSRRRVVLVDHNELAQSAPGVEEAAITEIVDHHRVGDVQTAQPVLFLNLPVGSTATIVANRYRELDVHVPDAIAGLLLSAVLTDTVLLKSPTATEADREVVDVLSAQLGLDALEFGMELFGARTVGVEFSAVDAIDADLKEYRIGDALVAIGQVETVDATQVLQHREELLAAMGQVLADRRYDLCMLMVTDVVREGSELLAVGATRLAERGLGASFADGSAWLDGVLSRKKQVAARLLEASG